MKLLSRGENPPGGTTVTGSKAKPLFFWKMALIAATLVSFCGPLAWSMKENLGRGLSYVLDVSLDKATLAQEQIRHRFERRWRWTTFFFEHKKKQTIQKVAFYYKTEDSQSCDYEFLISVNLIKKTLGKLYLLNDGCEKMGPGSRRRLHLKALENQSLETLETEVDWQFIRKLYPEWSDLLEKSIKVSFDANPVVKKKLK